MKNKGFISPHILLLIIVISAVLGVSLYFKNTRQQTTVPQNSDLTESITPEDKIQDRPEPNLSVKVFIRDDITKFPDFQKKVTPESIQSIFPITITDNYGMSTTGWVVGVLALKTNETSISGNTKFYTYYLLTPTLQKELTNTDITSVDDVSCPLENVQEVGGLREKGGYIVLSGNECGGFSRGFVSVYTKETGKKIKMQGNFSIIVGMGKVGVSPKGDVEGRLKGIYGTKQPTLIVEYGLFGYAPTIRDQVEAVAYFDLQTGVLKQLIRFE